METQPSMRKQVLLTIAFVAIGVGMMIMLSQMAMLTNVEAVPYSKFDELLAKGAVTEVTIGADTIEAKPKDPLPNGKSIIATTRVDIALAEKLEAKDITVSGTTPSLALP